MSRRSQLLGAIFAFLSVALGAFGAHALRASLTPEQMAIYQTGIQYQALHALALLFLGTQKESKLLNAASLLFPIGIVIFSGSLYALSISGVKWLGAITPLGGVSFLAGWACVIAGVAASRPEDRRSS